MPRLTYVDAAKPFIATWDLEGFRDLLAKGIDFGSECFFLIKKIGICLYVRSTDFEGRSGDDFQDFTVHADGLDEDSLDCDADDYAERRKDLYSISNPLYPGDLCEWFALHPEMIDDCDLMLERGFDKLRITVDSLTLDLSPFSESDQNGLRSGGVFTHNRSIRWFGGDCPLSGFDCSIRFDYMKSDEGDESACNSWDERDEPLHLNRETIKTYFA